MLSRVGLLRLTNGRVPGASKRRVAPSPSAVRAHRQIQAVGVAEVRVMARRARDVLRAREDRVPEEQPSELDFFGRRRIVGRRDDLERAGCR